ncbi:hypothetical protein [Brachybacterium sp. 107]|uniref:hypothetical protein n=1 Tax=Brachybacterium sp. 107 TaxID=3457736 RepID=UPI004033FE8C
MIDRAGPQPTAIEVRGARVHNLRDLDVDVPLHRVVGIAGVSGYGKSSLAMGVLYAEGSRRYLDALSRESRFTGSPRAESGGLAGWGLPRWVGRRSELA